MKNKKGSKRKAKKTEEIKLSEIKKEVRKEEIKPVDDEEFFEEPVRQISFSAETRTPVLERIIQRETPAFAIDTRQEKEKTNEKRADYSPNSNQRNYGFINAEKDEEKKYESNFIPPVLTRREMPNNSMRKEFLDSAERQIWSNRVNESQLNEIEFVEQERKLPFEEQQKKYRRFKLR